MVISSKAFRQDEFIPVKYTCDGMDVNPPLTFSDIPDSARSLVLVMDDPDSKSGLFTHWMLYNISPGTELLSENARSAAGTLGRNDFGTIGYGGPCPPTGAHHYYFRLFALNDELYLPEGLPRQDLNEALKNHIIEVAELVGLYEKRSEPSEVFAQDLNEYTDDRNTSEGQLITV